jgi:MFS family permease
MLLSLVGGLRAMTDNGLRTFIPFYLVGLGMGPALVGTYLAVVQGAGLVASPLSGLLSDRVGRKPLVAGGMLATTVVVLVFANLSLISIPGVDFGWLFVGALSLLGFFLYAMRPALQAWTMDMVPKEMGGTTVGLMFGSQALFAAVSPAVGGILADAFGLMAAFYFVAATILAANIVVMLVPERLIPESKAEAAPSPAVGTA